MANNRELMATSNENAEVSLNSNATNLESEAHKKDYLSKLPSSLIFEILSHLKPETILTHLPSINKQINKMSKDNLVWLGKFLRHYDYAYPAVILKYENLSEPKACQDINWQEEFINTYRDELEYFSDRPERQERDKEAKGIIEFLSLIKENDFESLFDKEGKAIDIPSKWLWKKDKNKKSIIETACKIGYQPILDFIYNQIILKSMRNGTPFPATQLYYALRCHQSLKEIIGLLKPGSMDEKYFFSKYHPIHIAAHEGNLDVVKYFIENGVSLNAMDEIGYTPLTYAAMNGQTSVVSYLLEQNEINLNAAIHHAGSDQNGKTALHLASANGHVEVVNLLIAAHADATLESDDMGYLPIHLAAQSGKVEIVSALIKENPEVWDKPDKQGQTPLLWAASRGHRSIVEFLLDQSGVIQFFASVKKYKKGNIDLNAKSIGFNTTLSDVPNDQTALHWASKNGHHEIVRLLLKAGADATSRAQLGSYQPLHLAVLNGQLAAVKVLLDMKPELINLTDFYGRTPLVLAIINKHLSIVEFLLSKKDINLNAQMNGYSGNCLPLNYAVNCGFNDIVDVLLRHGAKLSVAQQVYVSKLNPVVQKKIQELRYQENLLKFSMFYPSRTSILLQSDPSPHHQTPIKRKNSF